MHDRDEMRGMSSQPFGIQDMCVVHNDVCCAAVGILPAHGRMCRFANLEDKKLALLDAANSFEKDDGMDGMLSIGYY
jgi:hypothetical protein